jgi:hypothetical protein
MKRLLFSLFLAGFLYIPPAFCQYIWNAELNATPLSVNPAFTGKFDGSVRAGVFYESDPSAISSSYSLPYDFYGVSVDLPVFRTRRGDYLAAGIQMVRQTVADGNIVDFKSVASASYHKIFKAGSDTGKGYYDLAFGVQVGFDQFSIDLVNYYFGGPPYSLGLGNTLINYPLNAGICFSHAAGTRLNYSIGIAGYHLEQPDDRIELRMPENLGWEKLYIGMMSAEWKLADRLQLRPAIFVENRPGTFRAIAGSEVRYKLGKKRTPGSSTWLFAGMWYYNDGEMTITTGIESHRLQVGLGFRDSSLWNGDSFGGIVLSMKYIAPGHRSHHHNHAADGLPPKQ